MPLRYPRSAAYVAIGGAPLDVPFFNARCTYGFDQNVSSASVEVPYVTRRLAVGTWINLFIGASPAIPTSFVGRITGYDWRNWPKSVVVQLRGPLSLAEEYYPSSPVDLAGETDISAIQLILTTAGIPSSQQLILGSGATLGLTVAPGSNDQRFVWQSNQTALDMIQAIDEAFIFRTFDSGGSGLVMRRAISSIPLADASYTFTGGVDIGEGGSTHLETHKGTAGTVVFGYTGQNGIQILSTQAAGSRSGGSGYDVIDNPLIETQSQADDLAAWGAAELGRPLLTVILPTPRDDAVRPGQTIDVQDPDRLNVQKRMWAQSITRSLETGGAFTQTITLISEAVVDSTSSSPGVQHLPGTSLQESAPASGAINDPAPDFTFEAIDHEITDAAAEFWIVQVRDASWSPGGSIASRAWSTDTTTVPDTSTEQEFLFKTTDLATIITLSVTDSLGNTASVSKPCNGPDASGVLLNRHLYVAGSSAAIAYDGAGTWNVQSLTTDVVANGPAWNDAGNVAISADDLATAPTSVSAFASENTSAVFCETDVNVSNVYAGGDGGSVSISTDGGVSWAETTGPSAQAVRRIIASRFTPGELWVLDDAGDVYQSPNYGNTWSLIASHPGAVDMCLSNYRNWVGGSFGVKTLETGLTATWPGATPNIVAIDSHIREDRVYALADDGSTFYIDPAAGLDMVAGASLPAGTAQVRGVRRDGACVDLIYLASGTNGLYKSHDGLRTTAAYTLIYAGGEDIKSVGYGDFALGSGLTTPLFFIRGSWYALLGDGTFSSLGTEGSSSVVANPYADSATVITVVAIGSGTPNPYYVFESSDGGATWSTTTSGTLPTNTQGINSLLLPYRNGAFRALVFERTGGQDGGTLGGEYSSSDGSAWTRTGRAAPKVFPTGTQTANPDGFGVTSASIYYLLDTLPSGGNLALHVNTESGTPEVQRLSTVGTVSGGTFNITCYGATALNIAWNASAATILSALQALTTFGAGGSASGTLAGDDLDITFPYDGPQSLMTIDSGNITGGGSIGIAVQTAGTAGIYEFTSNIVPISNGLCGAFTADVLMIITGGATFPAVSPILVSVGGATPSDVTPGFLTANDGVFSLVSSDGDTWVGSMYDDSVANNRLLVTHDQGATWTKVGPTTIGADGIQDITPDPVTAGKWWALFKDGFTGHVYVSTDDGDTWAQQGGDMVFLPSPSMAVPIGGKSH